MSQPASFDQPREGETILACPHDLKWKRKLFFIGDIREGKPTGLGRYVQRRSPGTGNPEDRPIEGIWVRWVSLCWFCDLWRRVRKQEPMHMAKREVLWGENR